MELYLIRHADAVDEEEDPTRPLSDRGRKQVRKLASFLSATDIFQPAEVWHSPLRRARETARLLVRGLASPAALAEVPGLQPDDQPAVIARRLGRVKAPVAVVGHEPHLSALASLLIGGRVEAPVFVVRKCAVIALAGGGKHWQVRWHFSPELLP